MKIKYHCPSGHTMKRVKDTFGFKTWKCTGLINKLRNGKTVLDVEGKPEKIKCPHSKAWSYISQMGGAYQ